MSVASDDPRDFGWVETTRSNPHGREVSHYEIFTLQSPEGGTLMAQVDEAEPVEAMEHAEQAAFLREAVDALPESMRQAVQLRIWGGLPFSEIGSRLGRNAGAARKRFSRGVSLLRQRMAV